MLTPITLSLNKANPVTVSEEDDPFFETLCEELEST